MDFWPGGGSWKIAVEMSDFPAEYRAIDDDCREAESGTATSSGCSEGTIRSMYEGIHAFIAFDR